jgi:hypothetical protein
MMINFKKELMHKKACISYLENSLKYNILFSPKSCLLWTDYMNYWFNT